MHQVWWIRKEDLKTKVLLLWEDLLTWCSLLFLFPILFLRLFWSRREYHKFLIWAFDFQPESVAYLFNNFMFWHHAIGNLRPTQTIRHIRRARWFFLNLNLVVKPSSKQPLSCILIGCSFYAAVLSLISPLYRGTQRTKHCLPPLCRFHCRWEELGRLGKWKNKLAPYAGSVLSRSAFVRTVFDVHIRWRRGVKDPAILQDFNRYRAKPWSAHA